MDPNQPYSDRQLPPPKARQTLSARVRIPHPAHLPPTRESAAAFLGVERSLLPLDPLSESPTEAEVGRNAPGHRSGQGEGQ